MSGIAKTCSRGTFIAAYLLSGVASAQSAPATQPWKIVADHADGIYRAGETVRWSIHRDVDAAASPARFRLLEGQITERQTLDMSFGQTDAEVHFALDHPGTLLLKSDGVDNRSPGIAGVVFAPDQIKPSAEKPADFDEFWKAKFDELAAVDSQPQLTPGDSGKQGVDYWQITLNNIRGIKICGQLARPHGDAKCPALLIVQWAGVYGLEKHWAVDRAAEGYLVLNISPHDIPIDQPQEFYKAQFEGPLKNYWAIGNDDRETSYFLHMYLSCYRGAEYLANRQDWNGKTLVVMGGSQGGQQALLTASIYPKITAAMADVPAGCDMLGPTVGRKGGWPQWYEQTGGKDPVKVRAASRYYDIANFAARIHCPILVGAGLIDEVCPAAGVLSAVNQTHGPREVHLFPIGPHGLEQQTHTLWNDAVWRRWLPAMATDHAPPIREGID